MKEVQFPSSNAAIVAAFAQRHGIPPQAVMQFLIDALAAHIQTGRPVVIPITLGHLSQHCLVCPHAIQSQPEVKNVVNGPW